MKILFINPSGFDFVGTSGTNSPVLGLMYLAAVLDGEGYEAKVFDADVLKFSLNKLSEKIKQENPDIIGLTSTTLNMPVLYKTVEVCRKAMPNVKILVGGFGPTLEPEKTLMECREIDIVGMDECEITILELIKYFEKGGNLEDIKGIAFRKDNKIIITQKRELISDLDTIPVLNYDLLEPDFSHFPGVHGEHKGILRPNIVMMGSRGCPHRCIFCCNAGKLPRFRSPKKIVDEIEMYKKRFNIKSVQLYDNEFIGMSAIQNDWIKEICDEIIKRGLNDLGYMCQGRCSQFVDLSTLQKMKEAGFRWIWWGVESGSQKILDRIKKDITIENVKRAFSLARQAGIFSLMFIMVGFPDETKEDVKKTIKLIKDIRPDQLRIHITTPLPGSELWKELYEKKQIEEFDYFKYNTRLTAVHHTGTMSKREIEKYYRLLIFRFENNYWKFGKFLLKSLKKTSGWKKLPKRIVVALNYFFERVKILFTKS